MPAPPRFLPAYDNLLLSHKDRTRVIPHNRPVPLPPGNGASDGTFLVDGRWQGTWQIWNQTLLIRPFTKLRPPDRDSLLAEAPQLRAFVAPQAKYDIVLDKP
jgi:Winged helix DNA-binding domain